MAWLKPFTHWGFLLIQLITALLAIRCWNISRSVFWKAFIVVWVFTFLVEGAGKIMGSQGVRNIWLYNIFYVVFYPAIILFYVDVFKSAKIKWLIIISAFALCLWAIIYLLSGNHVALNTYYVVVASSVIIVLAISYLIKLFLDKDITTPLRIDFYYWFSTGFVIYFVFTAVMQGMYTKLLESKTAWLPLFTFYANHIITLVLHLCLWTGFRAALKWMK